MKAFSLIIIVLLLLNSDNIFAQPWINNLISSKLNKTSNLNELNFFEMQKAFNQYWKGKKIGRSKGWKPFKRWEWFMQSRINKDGHFDKTALWKAWQDKKMKFPKGTAINNSDWKSLGPKELPAGSSPTKGLGRINCIAVDPGNSNIIWVGSPSGGLWKSANGGNSWNTNTDFLDALGVSSILISPFNPDIMYIATGDRDAGDTYNIGILKSTDGGQNWFLPSNDFLVMYNRMYKLIMHPSDENIIYACSDNGILKSADGGESWINTDANNAIDLIMDNSSPNILYAVTRYYDNSFNTLLIKSTDGGESWFKLTKGLPDSTGYVRAALAISPSQPNIIYSVFTDDKSGLSGIYKSTDGGNNWTLKADSPNMLGYSSDGSDAGGQGWYDLALVVDPTDPDIVYLGGINIWKTTDGGNSWQINAHWYGGSNGNIPIVHADIHTFEFIPGTDFLLCGCDGGLYKTTSGGKSWQDLSSGLAIQQFYRLGGSQQIPYLIYSGAQDNGTSLFNYKVWTNVSGGDGMECAVDYTNPNIAYVSYQNGSFMKTTDGGINFSDINDSVSENGAWTTPFVIHPANPQILFRTTTKVYKSSDRGNSWLPISGVLDAGRDYENVLNILKISKSNPDYIYCAGANIYKTTDGGEDWIALKLPNQNGYGISDIAIDPENPEKIYITSSLPFGNEKIYKSLNGGSSWINISGDIPENLSVNCIVVQDEFPGELYIGTDIGVFYSGTDGDNWQDYSENLPNVVVDELEINNISGKLRAATYGRGLWESPLNKITPAISIISPNGGESLQPNSFTKIKWSSLLVKNVKIEFSSDSLTTWNTVVPGISADSGNFNWNVPDIPSQFCKIKISDLQDSSLSGISYGYFSIYPAVSVEENNKLPVAFELVQNYPNPFNPSTKIRYSIPVLSFVNLKVYDVLGREVAKLVDREQAAGNYEIEFDGSGLSSGIYFYKIQAGAFTAAKKLILIR